MEGWFFEMGSVAIEEFAVRSFLARDGPGDYWTHLLSWWRQRDNPDVLLLVYERMLREPRETIRRVAQFLGIPLDAELLEIAASESSFESMLAHKDRYDDLLMRQYSEAVAHLPPGSESSKVRKGQAGEHKVELPASVAARMDEIWGPPRMTSR